MPLPAWARGAHQGARTWEGLDPATLSQVKRRNTPWLVLVVTWCPALWWPQDSVVPVLLRKSAVRGTGRNGEVIYLGEGAVSEER